MAGNVEPEEAEALQDALSQGDPEQAVVAERDFSRPVRLSEKELEELERSLAGVVPEMEVQLAATLGSSHALALSRISESSATNLFAGEDAGPYAALRFEVHGQPAWLIWENIAAVRAVESILGSTAGVDEPRRLSPIEGSVLEGLLAPVLNGSLQALAAEGEGVFLAQSKEALGSWEDAGDLADPYRLHIEYHFDGPGGSSHIECYIPIDPHARTGAATEPVELPSHLDEVTVTVSARITGCDLQLEQLLQLEVGDVIPLDGQVGDPAVLCVEGKPHASGVLGMHHGLVSVRIEQLNETSESES